MPVSTTTMNMGDVDFSIAGFIKTKPGGTIISKVPLGSPWPPNGKSLYVDNDGSLTFEIGLVDKLKSKTKVNDNNWHEVGLVHVASEDRLVYRVELCFVRTLLLSLCGWCSYTIGRGTAIPLNI